MMTAMRFGLPKDHKLANYLLRKALDLIRHGEDNGRGMMDDDIEDSERMLKGLELRGSCWLA